MFGYQMSNENLTTMIEGVEEILQIYNSTCLPPKVRLVKSDQGYLERI